MAAKPHSEYEIIQKTGYKETAIITANSLSELREKLDEMGGFKQ
jgi:hypothetical protein